MVLVQQQFENLVSFVYMFELSYPKEENILGFIIMILIQTDSLFGGIATVSFSTKFGVAPRPNIT